MENTAQIKVIARIRSDFKSKFGIPRQSGVVPELKAQIVFEPEFREPEAVRGLEEFSHIWLIWQFSECLRDTWSPTVRPPRLGGNERVGVFASRSPYRPNSLGLSSVRLDKVELNETLGPVLHVSGADLMDGTPIFDIKPYIPYGDSHPDASGGFTDARSFEKLSVAIAPELEARIPPERREALRGVLENDPRPRYHDDPERIYGFGFGCMEVKFRVKDGTLEVTDIII